MKYQSGTGLLTMSLKNSATKLTCLCLCLALVTAVNLALLFLSSRQVIKSSPVVVAVDHGLQIRWNFSDFKDEDSYEERDVKHPVELAVGTYPTSRTYPKSTPQSSAG